MAKSFSFGYGDNTLPQFKKTKCYMCPAYTMEPGDGFFKKLRERPYGSGHDQRLKCVTYYDLTSVFNFYGRIGNVR